MELGRQQNESLFEWKFRLCKAKLEKEIDLDWQEIVDLLGLNVSADHLRKTAYGMLEYHEYLHNYNGVATTILSISDLHVPFQLDKEILSDFIGKIDVLQINGDVVDCQALSKWSRQYRISPIEEIIKGRQYLIDLIEYLKPKSVVCNYGNHDKRFSSYLAKNLDTDLLELLPDTSLDLIFEDGFTHYDKRTKAKVEYSPIAKIFDNVEIKYVKDWKVKIGRTWFVHPIAYKQNVLGTAEKAKIYLQDCDEDGFDCVVCAHTHNIGDSKRGYVRMIEQGAFCDVNSVVYADGKLARPQKQGFVIVCQDENGKIINDKTKLYMI